MEGRERILSDCRQFLPQWNDAPDDSFSISICMSTSNTVYCISTSHPSPPQQAIYRIFGAAAIVDFEKERSLFERLSQLGFGPKSYGSTAVYRVEEFIPGRALERLELKDEHIVGCICQELKKLHEQNLSDSVDDKTLVTLSNAQHWREVCYQRLPTFVLSACDKSAMDELLSDALWEQFTSLLPCAPLVFSHNDCNAQNFLFVSTEDRIRAIDFEYSGYSFRGMDLALTINELLYCYTHPHPPYWSYHPDSLYTDDIITMYVNAYGGDADLWAEIRICLCIGHFHWALWALAMNREGGFDYVKYAILRMNDFKREVEAIKSMGGAEGVRKRAREVMPA